MCMYMTLLKFKLRELDKILNSFYVKAKYKFHVYQI